MVTPLFEDWKKAGKLVAVITRREAGREFKVQQMLNDILLALSARRMDADLYTLNREDFKLIHRYQPFSLELLDYWHTPGSTRSSALPGQATEHP